MSIKQPILSISIFLFGIGAQPILAQPSEKVVQSVSPAALLAAFPVVPETWKCVESKGITDVSVLGVPITTAIRRYEIPAEDPPDNKIPTTAQEPKTLRMIAMDLGSRVDGPAPRSVPNKNVFSLPGLTGEIKSFPGRFIYEGIGEKRLIIQIEVRGISTPEFSQILTKLPLQPLVALEKRFPSKIIATEKRNVMILENEMPVTFRKMNNIIIDELDPSKNRTWESSTFDTAP